MKRVLAIAVSALMLVALTATVGQAGTTPKTTGSVRLSDPTQYLSYNAFESTPVKGSVSYTNFAVERVGTGVWVPTTFDMAFAVAPSTTTAATYAMTVTWFTPTSPTSLKFGGTGDCGCGWISTFTGSVDGDSFSLSMTEINAGNPAETYAMIASGSIASDGSITDGDWSDDYGSGRTGKFAVADIGFEAYHYTAAVTSASVTYPTATFSYVNPFYGSITVSVSDGGSPGEGNDTLTFVGIGTFSIVGGNLNVFA